MEKVNLAQKLSTFNDYFNPRVAGELNGQQVKLVKFKGEFVWHAHDDTDEAFIVLAGSMKIEFRDGEVNLSEGEMYIVKKGVEHRPVAGEDCQLLLIEPRGVVNTGNAGGEMTAKNDVWI